VIWRSVLGVCLFCASHTFAQPAKRDFTFTTKHEFNAHDGLIVDVYNPTGSIKVRPSSASVIQIKEQIAIPATDSSYAAMFLNEAVITLSVSDERVSMAALVRRPTHSSAAFGGLLDVRLRTRARVHFEVYVPSGIYLVAATTDGSIQAEQTDCELELTSTSGRLDLTASANRVSMTTTSGAIGVSGCNAHLAIATSDGAVSAARSDGELSIVSQTGAISVLEWNGDVRLETGSGQIETARTNGALFCQSRSGRCVIKSHQGGMGINSQAILMFSLDRLCHATSKPDHAGALFSPVWIQNGNNRIAGT
jgi:hypothetical protein